MRVYVPQRQMFPAMASSICASVGEGVAALAVTALRHLVLHPRPLNRVVADGAQTLDGDDGLAVDVLHGGDAGARRLALEMDRTSTALRDSAPVLRACEAELVTEIPEQRHRGVSVEPALDAVHAQSDHEDLLPFASRRFTHRCHRHATAVPRRHVDEHDV
jgi:hypothetical protein